MERYNLKNDAVNTVIKDYFSDVISSNIHTCRSYVHTPRELDRPAVESPTGTFIVLHALADSSDLGFRGGSKVPQNGRFPTLDASEPQCKI